MPAAAQHQEHQPLDQRDHVTVDGEQRNVGHTEIGYVHVTQKPQDNEQDQDGGQH